jgi:hypothetical protein
MVIVKRFHRKGVGLEVEEGALKLAAPKMNYVLPTTVILMKFFW